MTGSKIRKENKAGDTRGSTRIFTHPKARFLFKEKEWQECTIININPKGVGVAFHTREKINAGSIVLVEIFVPDELEPIKVKGTIQWIKQEKSGTTGGIKLTEELDEVKLAKIS